MTVTSFIALLLVLAGCPSRPQAPEREATPALPAAPAAGAAAALPWSAVDGRDDVDASGALHVLGDPRLRNRGYIYGFALNETRSRLVTTQQHSIRVWDLPAGALAFEVPLGGTRPAFLGETLESGTPLRGERRRSWDAAGHEVIAPYPACAGSFAVARAGLVACAQSAPPRVRVTGAMDTTLVFADLEHPFETGADAIAISPDRKWLAASTGFRVHVFDLATGRRAWVRPLRTSFECFAFDSAGRLVVADHAPHREHTTLALIDAGDGATLVERPVGDVSACDVSPGGDAVVTVGETHEVRVFSLPALDHLAQLPTLPLQLRKAAFSADGRRLWIVSEAQILAWELATQRWSPTLGHVGTVHALALSPDGETVATAGSDGKLILWPLAGGAPRTLRDGLDFALTAVAFSFDGRHVAVGSAADTISDLGGTPDAKSVVELWDVARGTRVYRRKRSASLIRSLGFTRHGRLHVLDAWAELATLDAKTGALRAKRKLATGDVEVTDSVFSRDAMALSAQVHAGFDSMHVNETITGKRLAGDVSPDAIPVIEVYAPDDPAYAFPFRRGGAIVESDQFLTCRAFHPDGERYIACSPDGLVRIWRIAAMPVRD